MQIVHHGYKQAETQMHPLEQEELGAEEVKYKPKETSNPMESSEFNRILLNTIQTNKNT